MNFTKMNHQKRKLTNKDASATNKRNGSESGSEHKWSLWKKQLTLGIPPLTFQNAPGTQPEEPSEGERMDRNEESGCD